MCSPCWVQGCRAPCDFRDARSRNEKKHLQKQLVMFSESQEALYLSTYWWQRGSTDIPRTYREEAAELSSWDSLCHGLTRSKIGEHDGFLLYLSRRNFCWHCKQSLCLVCWRTFRKLWTIRPLLKLPEYAAFVEKKSRYVTSTHCAALVKRIGVQSSSFIFSIYV